MTTEHGDIKLRLEEDGTLLIEVHVDGKLIGVIAMDPQSGMALGKHIHAVAMESALCQIAAKQGKLKDIPGYLSKVFGVDLRATPTQSEPPPPAPVEPVEPILPWKCTKCGGFVVGWDKLEPTDPRVCGDCRARATV